MTIEVDILSEMWLTCKEYIATKDRQAAADHIISVVSDHSLTEQDLRALAVDSYLERAVNEYLGDEDFMGENDDDEDPDY